jgi:hypothetical protein
MSDSQDMHTISMDRERGLGLKTVSEDAAATSQSAPNNAKGHSKPADDVLLFGVSLARLSPTQSFVFLSFGALFCALTFAALQEKVFLIEGAAAVMTVETRRGILPCRAE